MFSKVIFGNTLKRHHFLRALSKEKQSHTCVPLDSSNKAKMVEKDSEGALPSNTELTLKQTVNAVLKYPIDFCDLNFITIFKNS